MKKLILSLGILLTAAVSYSADSQVTKLSTVTWNQTQKTDVLYLATGVSTVSASKQVSLQDVLNSTHSTYYIPYSSASTSFLGISSTPWTSNGYLVFADSAAFNQNLLQISSFSAASLIASTETITGPKTFSNFTTFSGTAQVRGVRPVLGVKAINTGDDAVLRLDTNNNGDRSFVDFLMSGTRRWSVGTLGSTTKLSFSTTFLAGSDVLALNTAQLTASSSTGSLVAISGTWSQTSTAGGTDLLVNRYESVVGSGAQLLADFQVASTSKFKIDNTGAATAVGGFISSANNFLATVNNTSSANNARIQMLSTGASINRNIADQNPALIANQINASSTGDILNFQFGSVSKASVTANGGVVISSEIFSSGSLPIASTNTALEPISMLFDGGGIAIVAGSTKAITVPYDCQITSATVVELSGTSGSISIDIKRIAFSNSFDYTTFVSMVGASGNKPNLVSQQAKAITPTSWTSTQLLAGDVLAFVSDSATSVKLVSITLWIRKN